MTIAEQFDALIFALPMNLSVLVIPNLAGAHRRINGLALIWAAWAAILVGVLLVIAFFVLGASYPGCDPAVTLPFHLTMIVLFCSFVGIFIFFLINDYAAGLKIYIFAATGEIFTPTGARLRGKAIAAFIAVGVIPVSLAILEIFAFPEVRQLQGVTTAQGLLFDFILIVVMAGTTFFSSSGAWRARWKSCTRR